MKTYIKAFVAVTICLASCKKLDLTPPDKLSTTVFWKTDTDADLALAGIYNTFYAKSGGGVDLYGPMWWESYSDNSFSTHSLGGSSNSLTSGIFPAAQSGSGHVYDLYANAYVAIAACNSFLANIEKVLTGDKLNQYKGEVYFVRGFNYFMLAQTYGNVPIVTADPFTIDYKSKMAKSPRADVLKQAETDLDAAIAGLAKSNTAYTNGHVVKATAQGYKIRLLLFEKKYAEAAALAKEIIDGGLFSLSNNYAGNFYKPEQRSSPEIMFSVQFQAPVTYHDVSLSTLLLNPGYTDLQGTQDLVNEYEANDPRKKMTFFSPGDTQADGWPITSYAPTPGVNGWTLGFVLGKKWVDPHVLNPPPGLRDDQDLVLLRYADIKLMYAEAQNENAGPDATVYKQINEVRARPGVNMPALPNGLSKDDMRLRIRHERRIEFALEGLRYFDLRRWGIAKEKLNGFVLNPLTPAVKGIYKDNYEFWPIPQPEIDRNAPVLKQNDGY